jgi:hypothetical protein
MASMIWKFSFRAGTSSGGVDTAGIVLATAVVGLSFRQAQSQDARTSIWDRRFPCLKNMTSYKLASPRATLQKILGYPLE